MPSDDNEKNTFDIEPSIIRYSQYVEFERKVNEEIDDYEEYIATMESFLKAKAFHHSRNIETTIESGNDLLIDEDGDPYDPTEYDQYMIGRVNQFQNLLRQSFFVALFSYFETKLVNECNERKPSNQALLLSDISGKDDLTKVRTYFRKVLKFPFPTNTSGWQEIQNFRRIRNLIVHNKGKLSTIKNDEIEKYLKDSPYLEIIEDEIFIKTGFCLHALKSFKSFLLKLTFESDDQVATQ